MTSQMVEHYDVSVGVVGGLPDMRWLCDVIADALEERLRLSRVDYTVRVQGPPELSIGRIMAWD